MNMARRAKNAASEGVRLSSVANAILLMKTFSDEQGELGISALAARLGLAKSTVHRLASTLVDAGMLEQNQETGKYRLGLAVFELGSLVRAPDRHFPGSQAVAHDIARADRRDGRPVDSRPWGASFA